MKMFIPMIFLATFLFNQSFFGISTPLEISYPIFDAPGHHLPRNLRTVKQKFLNDPYSNAEGLEQLQASGSGQFSEETFAKLIEHLALTDPSQLIVFDLRQESHGLINGLPICWTDGLYKYGNLNKTSREIEWDEFQRLKLANQEGLVLIDPHAESTELVVNRIKTERELVEDQGHHYIRLPVTDHNRPSDQIVDEFIQIVSCLSSDKWLHFHCRAGKGRTTTFLTLLDMMKNAKYVSLEDILTRQQMIGGSNLKAFESKEGEMRRAAEERLIFLTQFYRYCHEEPNFEMTWSDWVSQPLALATDHP